MRSSLTRSPSRRGGAAVEFGLLALPLLAILTGVIDYGWFFATQHVLQNATHHAARAAATTPQGLDPVVAAQEAARVRWAQLGLRGDIDVSAVTSGDPQVVEVSVSRSAPYLVGLVPVPPIAQVTVRRRMEEQPIDEEG